MKTPENFPGTGDAFFEQQENSILNKTTRLEGWKFYSAGRPEDSFPLPEGYFLSMEEGIRRRIKPEKTGFDWGMVRMWKPVTAFCLLLAAAAVLLNFPVSNEAEQVVQARIQQLDQQAVLDYLTENPENLEISQQVAMQQISETNIELPAEMKLNAEELLDHSLIDETDIENNL